MVVLSFPAVWIKPTHVPHNEKEGSEISLSTYLYNGVVVNVAQVDTTGTEWLLTSLVVYDSDTEIIRLTADTEAEEDDLDGWKEELKDEEPTRETWSTSELSWE